MNHFINFLKIIEYIIIKNLFIGLSNNDDKGRVFHDNVCNINLKLEKNLCVRRKIVMIKTDYRICVLRNLTSNICDHFTVPHSSKLHLLFTRSVGIFFYCILFLLLLQSKAFLGLPFFFSSLLCQTLFVFQFNFVQILIYSSQLEYQIFPALLFFHSSFSEYYNSIIGADINNSSNSSEFFPPKFSHKQTSFHSMYNRQHILSSVSYHINPETRDIGLRLIIFQ